MDDQNTPTGDTGEGAAPAPEAPSEGGSSDESSS
jgi:hypothetical protein